MRGSSKCQSTVFVPLKGKKLFGPRPQNRILVPFRFFFQNFRRSSVTIIWEYPPAPSRAFSRLSRKTLYGSSLVKCRKPKLTVAYNCCLGSAIVKGAHCFKAFWTRGVLIKDQRINNYMFQLSPYVKLKYCFSWYFPDYPKNGFVGK